MLDKILDLAESLGNQIVHKKGQSVPAVSKEDVPAPIVSEGAKPAAHTQAKVLYYRLKPFKDNELGTGYRQGFLKSFSDITDPISFYITGSNYALSLYAKIPAGIQFYFENLFYASFPTSELIMVDSIPQVPVTQYIAYGEKDVLATDKDFTKDGNYLDPMKDIFSVYENVDQLNNITLQFTYTFKKKDDPRKKYVDMIKKFVAFLVKKEETKDGEAKKE